MKSILASLSVLGSLAGCANQETMLRNSAGDVRYCYLVHNGSLSSIAATDQYTKCLNDAGAAGYRRVEK
jgi:hypothetical protein